MNAFVPAIFVSILLAIAACSPSEPPKTPEAPAPAGKPAPVDSGPSFSNKVWAVAESPQVEVGSLRVFLSEGTMVMASANAKPAFGSWTQESGRLSIAEEGLKYDVDILELTENRFRIRIHNPGEPVEILFRPAEPAPVVAARAMAARIAEPEVTEPAPMSLWGTAWRLENLAGAGVVDRIQATLEFPQEGRANGNGSCNRFNGVVTIEGETIKFGGIAATRKACPEAVMNQEEAYFAALRDAERFESDGKTLSIFATGRDQPLRFIASQATATRSGISRSSGPAGALPALAGIWTIIGHHTQAVGGGGEEEPRKRHGESVRLTASAAVSPTGRCDEPVYSSRQVSADAYLTSQFKPAREILQPLAARSEFTILDVSCNGAPWAALGGQLLAINGDRVLTLWNGVYFEMERDRDFRAVGQEPGWQLEIRKGSEMRFTYDYGKGTAVTPAPAVKVDASNGTRTFHAVTEANDLTVAIVPVACTDSMSGRRFPATVSVTLNGKSFRGCGEVLATPYQG